MGMFLVGFAAGGLAIPIAIVVGVDLAVSISAKRMAVDDEPPRTSWPRKSTLRKLRGAR